MLVVLITISLSFTKQHRTHDDCRIVNHNENSQQRRHIVCRRHTVLGRTGWGGWCNHRTVKGSTEHEQLGQQHSSGRGKAKTEQVLLNSAHDEAKRQRRMRIRAREKYKGKPGDILHLPTIPYTTGLAVVYANFANCPVPKQTQLTLGSVHVAVGFVVFGIL